MPDRAFGPNPEAQAAGALARPGYHQVACRLRQQRSLLRRGLRREAGHSCRTALGLSHGEGRKARALHEWHAKPASKPERMVDAVYPEQVVRRSSPVQPGVTWAAGCLAWRPVRIRRQVDLFRPYPEIPTLQDSVLTGWKLEEHVMHPGKNRCSRRTVQPGYCERGVGHATSLTDLRCRSAAKRVSAMLSCDICSEKSATDEVTRQGEGQFHD